VNFTMGKIKGWGKKDIGERGEKVLSEGVCSVCDGGNVGRGGNV